MKIVILCGENVVASRARMIDIISKFRAKGEVIKGLPTIGESLFGEKSLYVVEEITNFSQKDLEWAFKNRDRFNANLLIWHKGSLPVVISRIIPKDAKVEKFEVPKVIFNFLENIIPGKTGQVVKVLHKLAADEPLEFIFALIARHFRDLYWVIDDPVTLNYPSWRTSKLKKQASLLGKTRVKKIINLLSEIDVDSKTSKQNLLTSLDLLFAQELQ